MNSISPKEIKTQLFFLSKESIRHIVLHSGCGIIYESKNSKKSSSNDIIISKNFSPLLCIYKKGTPKYNTSKSHNVWDKESFKREISPSANAFMSLCLLELKDYYQGFKGKDSKLSSFENLYRNLAKLQLDFYATYLRNAEGLFIAKKNIGKDGEIELSYKEKEVKLSDQAFMMLAYYAIEEHSDSKSCSVFLQFANDIKEMFSYYKEELYDLSFNECIKIALAFNLSYKYFKSPDILSLASDMTDFCFTKLEDYECLEDNIHNSSLLLINLSLCYKNTKFTPFKELAVELYTKLKTLFSEEEGIFISDNSKKEAKYSCTDIITYLLAMIMCEDFEDDDRFFKDFLNNIYKKLVVNSSLISAFPEPPNIDNIERYKNFSKKSQDIVEEICFKMPNSISCETANLPPYFIKGVTYNKKKESFSSSRTSFYSPQNMYLMYLIITLFKDDYFKLLNINSDNLREAILLNKMRGADNVEPLDLTETLIEDLNEDLNENLNEGLENNSLDDVDNENSQLNFDLEEVTDFKIE